MFSFFKKPDRATVNAGMIIAKEFEDLLKEHAIYDSEKPWIEIWQPIQYSKEIMEHVANIFLSAGWFAVAYSNSPIMLGERLESGVMSWVITDNSSLVLLTKENYLEWEKSRTFDEYHVLFPKLFFKFKTDVKVISPAEYHELKVTTA